MGTRVILYVEDDPHNFLLVKRALEAQGNLKVEHAESGEKGLELARRLHPSLILVDIQLPGMSGFDFLELCRAEPEISSVPKIALTANVTRGERDRAIQAGFEDFIAKPFSLSRLREIVNKWAR
ncbi:MAG: response regulator [Deltaproteobacteria bacterium]|nr:MAG: response regulator [Deltaproteobacteria bacterium]